jgi:predicted RNA-binding Zn ribbon-like protein
MFNRRLSAPRPTVKESRDKNTQNTQFVIAPNKYNVLPLLNFLPYERNRLKQNNMEESNVQNTVVLKSRPSQNDDTISDNSEMQAVSRAEGWSNRDQAGTTKVTPHILPEVALNIVGSTYDTIPTEVMNSQDDGYLSVLRKTAASMPERGTDEVNLSEQVKPTTLVLKPAAKAIAGANGISIAAPLSRAVVRKGQEVTIHFDPDAVAVVGPGGFADAHSDLLISYYKDIPSEESLIK